MFLQTIKVWDLESIHEKIHVIDRHDLALEEILHPGQTGEVLTKTRNCVIVWDIHTGKVKLDITSLLVNTSKSYETQFQIKQKIAESMVGAVLTQAKLTSDGRHLVMVESGNVCIWDLTNLTMLSKQCIPDEVVQIILYERDSKFLLVTKQKRESQTHFLCVHSRTIKTETKNFEFQCPVLRMKPVCLTFEEAYIVSLAWEKKVSHILLGMLLLS